MKKLVFAILFLVGGCQTVNDQNYTGPDYNYLASHINVVEKSSSHVIYEYSNVRIDEVAGIAAVYCHEHGEKKQALLHKIITRPDNRRHATFVCHR